MAFCQEREYAYEAELCRLQQELWRVQQTALAWAPTHGHSEETHRCTVSDSPANLEVKELRLKLLEKDSDIRALKDQLEDRAFRTDSEPGKRLIAKFKKLVDENKELGNFVEKDKTQYLHARVADHQKQIDFYKEQLRDMWKSYLQDEEENERKIQEKSDELEAALDENFLIHKELRILKISSK